MRQFALLTAVIAALVVTTIPAAAQARRTRPGGSAAKPASGRAVSVSGYATRGSSPTRVSGRATYGYYTGGSSYPGYWYPYYGYSSSYWYWGWPYYGYWGYWGWPYRYGYYSPPAGQQLRNAPALIETDLRPKKAEVLLDDAPVGQARDYNGSWDSLAVKPGEHMLEFRYPGYMSLRVHLDARPGGRYRITERLVEGEGIDPRSIELPPEPEAEPGGAVSTSVAPAEPPREQGSLTLGLLRVRASPPDAAVYLDGEFLARADELARMHGALPVAEGRHVIEVVRPGYEARRVEVEVGGEEPVKVTLELTPQR
jgi:hypothetical protein